MRELFLEVLQTSLAVGLIAGAVILLSPVLDRRFALGWRRWLWLGLALRLLLPWTPELPAVTHRVPVRDAVVWQDQVPAVQRPGVPLPTGPVTAPEQGVTALELASLVWILGMLPGAALPLIRYGRFRRRARRRAVPVSIPGLPEEVTGLCSPEVGAPVLMGFFSPWLVLPRQDYSREELDFILRHELIHHRRRDVWYRLLLTAARAIHWFNPLVWMLCRQAELDLERTCDGELAAGCSREERARYARVLLGAAAHRQIPMTSALCGGKKTLKARITAIFAPVRPKGWGILALLLTAAVGLSGLAACAVMEPEEPAAPEQGIQSPALPPDPVPEPDPTPEPLTPAPEPPVPEPDPMPTPPREILAADPARCPAEADWPVTPLQSCEIFVDPRLPMEITWGDAMTVMEGEPIREETGYSPDQGVASFWLDGVMYGFYQPSPGSAKDSYILRTITIQAGSEARTFRDIGLDTSLEEALARFPGKVTDWEWAINDLYDRGASRGWLEYGQGNYGLRMTAPEGTVHLTFSGKTHQMKYIWLYGPGL